MQKRNSLIILVVFVLSISGLHAQNTGFMGKRVIVNMGAELSPAWKRPVSEKLTFDTKYLSFNAILSPGIEVIAHKSGTAGLVYHYLGTRYNTPSRNGFSMEDDLYNVVEPLTAHGLGIFYKQYMRFADGRAPMGSYFKLQFDGFFYKCPSSYGNRTLTMTDHLFAMKLEMGTDFLVFNRLRLSTGFALGFPFSGYKGLGYDNEFLEVGIYTDQEIYDYARSRIFGAYWIGFTVGVGFLAF